MTKEELTQWFNEEFWPTYQNFVKTPFPTKWKAGTKGEALKKILRDNPSADLRSRIMEAIRAQIKHRIALYEKSGSMQRYNEITAYNKFYTNRHAVTWLNQMGYEDEIPGTQDLDAITSEAVQSGLIEKICCKDGCNENTMGPRIDWCASHYPETMGYTEIMKQNLRAHGLWKRDDETLEQWRLRCGVEGRKTLKMLGMNR